MVQINFNQTISDTEEGTILKYAMMKMPQITDLNNSSFKLLKSYSKSQLKKMAIPIIESLKEHLTQIQQLGWTVYGFNKDSITIIDQKIAIFSDPTILCQINNDKKKTIMFIAPIQPTTFIDPIITNAKELPYTVHINVIFYALAQLFVYCTYNTTDIQHIEKQIFGTKGYYFIHRCTCVPISDRNIVWI
jgi:hypothetical protein